MLIELLFAYLLSRLPSAMVAATAAMRLSRSASSTAGVLWLGVGRKLAQCRRTFHLRLCYLVPALSLWHDMAKPRSRRKSFLPNLTTGQAVVYCTFVLLPLAMRMQWGQERNTTHQSSKQKLHEAIWLQHEPGCVGQMEVVPANTSKKEAWTGTRHATPSGGR